MSSSGPRRRYTDEFKSDAVSLVTDHGYSSAEAARRLGINPNNVNRWVREHRDQENYAARSEASPKELQAEIQRLRKENKRLQMEREILKKAAVFFAKESD
jgi:transposase